MTLAEFLLGCLAEDERDARTATEAAGGDAWEHEGGPFGTVGPPPMSMCVDLYADVGEHVARWDPAQVLTEVEAKRRIVAAVCDTKWSGSYAVRDVVLGHLALPYAGRPGYREEWRP